MTKDLKIINVWLTPFCACLLFVFAWWLASQWMPLGKIEIENLLVKNWFAKHNQYLGAPAALLSLMLVYVALLLARFLRLPLKLWCCLLIICSALPWLLLGLQLIYFEKKYTDLAKALIAYSAAPMLVASGAVIAAALFCYYYHLLMRVWRNLTVYKNLSLLLLLMPLILSGCVGKLIMPACSVVKDQDLCYQWAAVQESRPEWCERIIGQNFSGSRVNPPRDKCYLQIAKTAGNLEACDQIQGGLMSYTREDCLLAAAKVFDDPRACKKLEDLAAIKCQMELLIKVTPEKIRALDEEIAKTKEGEELDDLKAKRAAMYEVLGAEGRRELESYKVKK